LLGKVEGASAAALSDEDLLALPVLYRATLSSLSVARATSLDKSLIDYLEDLSTRAYFLVYGVRGKPLERVGRFFAHDWPAAVKAVWPETLASGFAFILGAVVAFVLVGGDPDWFYAFVPREMAAGRDPAATAEFLRQTLYGRPDGSTGLSAFATFLFTHNVQISLMAFALGFAFGLPTVVLIFWNGCTLGAMYAVFARQGLGTELGGWLMIHGATELFACVLAGAAGLRIGLSLAFPGERTRMEAAAAAGRTAGAVMAGVVVMLLFAGLLEGFGRQLISADAVRYAIAIGTGVLWLAYFYGPRRVGR
jgi:uncharacterized membrane protein SpoIIM required for sporulation